MKKLFLLLVIATIMSCSKAITVRDIETGEVQRVFDDYNVTEITDTLVVRKFTKIRENGTHFKYYQLLGFYENKLPKNNKHESDSEYISIKYLKTIRIK